MCRGFDHKNGRNDVEVLKIKAFHVRLLFSTSTTTTRASSPASDYDSLTLHFPPRINGGPLEIDGFCVRPDTPAFVTLHRMVVASAGEAVVYGSRERLRVSEGLRFEIYACDVRVLKGIVRKDEEEGENWRLDCKAHAGELLLLCEADVWVEMEGLAAAAAAVMTEKVEIADKRRRTKTLTRSGMRESLEEIPEQRESEPEFDGCCGCCGGGECDDGKAAAEWRSRGVVDDEVEGVRWAVDVGIWVVCLGVGYLVSKASRNNRFIRMQRRLC